MWVMGNPQDLGFSGNFIVFLHTCVMLRNWWGGGGGDDDVPCTCTHVSCYATDGVGGGGVGMMMFLALAHMCHATQLMGWVGGGWGWWCSLHLHTCVMLRNWWGGWGGVGMMMFLALAHMCHALAHMFQDTAPSYEPFEVRQFGSHCSNTGHCWQRTISTRARFRKCVARIGNAQTESFLRFAFATRMFPKTFVESLRRHTDKA